MATPQLLTAYAGNWSGDGTGVTVLLPPEGTVGSGEVRGGAPATREFALLDPTRLVDRVDAVVLSGGSAFGLAAGDGVARLLRERGAGFPTSAGPVPIVVGMSLFDASAGGEPPTAESGRLAALAALGGEPFATGRVGAGTGATTGKWRGRLDPGGLGVAEITVGPARVAAVVAVNAWGDVLPRDGTPGEIPITAPQPMTNTTIAAVLTDAVLTKTECFLLAQSAHTGFARALHPAASRYDGDAAVALASGPVTLPDALAFDLLRAAATDVVAAAIRAAVTPPKLVP